MNKRQKLTMFFIVVLIIAGIISANKTEYATITGESFNIPKIEGNGYFERGENL